MGLFWETGMPEAWALSRRSGDKPEAALTGDGRVDPGIVARTWSKNMVDTGVPPVIPDPANMAPEGSVPTPDGGKTKQD